MCIWRWKTFSSLCLCLHWSLSGVLWYWCNLQLHVDQHRVSGSKHSGQYHLCWRNTVNFNRYLEKKKILWCITTENFDAQISWWGIFSPCLSCLLSASHGLYWENSGQYFICIASRVYSITAGSRQIIKEVMKRGIYVPSTGVHVKIPSWKV